jgi:hypothetical protein
MSEKKLIKFTVNITDPTKFAGLRKEIIFGYEEVDEAQP